MSLPPTLRQIAAASGVSLTTVSMALRGNRGVAAKTRARVQKVADAMGFRPDPLVSAFQSRLRTRRAGTRGATIGWIDDHRGRQYWRNQPDLRAARKRAGELGFSLDVVWLEEIRLDDPADTARRFIRVLHARGIDAVILPRLDRAHLVAEDWPGFAVVSLGHNGKFIRRSKVHRAPYSLYHEVVSDTAENFGIAFRTLVQRGYERIGLVTTEWFNSLENGLVIGLMMGADENRKTTNRVPPLIFPDSLTWDERFMLFRKWFLRHRPQALLITNLEIHRWVRDMGLGVPGDVALAHIELDAMDTELSGIDPRNHLQAEAAIDLVSAHLIRNEREAPAYRKRVLIVGEWRDAGTA